MTRAVGLIETAGLAISNEVTNVMLNAANVSYVHQEVEDIELVTILIEGDADSVKIAIKAGVEVAKQAELLFAFSIILNPDPDVKLLVQQGVVDGETYLKKNLLLRK